MLKNIDVSIVIRAYNESKHIGKLLKKIKNQKTNLKYEVIVVDSGSTDDTMEIALKNGAKVLKISPEQFTFGRSLNLGIKHAKGKHIAIISAHCYPSSVNWLSRLIEPLYQSEYALAYGSQRGNRFTKFSEKILFKQYFPEKSDLNQRTPFCNNANTAINKFVWEKIKYDEQLTGLEDIDWAKKIRSKNYKIAYVSDAKIIHIHDESYKQILNRYRREAIALNKIFPDSHFSFCDLIRLIISHIIVDSVIAIRRKNIKNHVLGILKFRTMQFLGTYLGYRQNNSITQEMKKKLYYPKI